MLKPSLLALLTLSSLSLLAPLGCAATTDGAEDDSAQSEDALTSLPTGHYAIARAPSSGSYVSKLTISAGKKVELEWVRVTTSSEPWVFNPYVRVPTTKKEALVLRGTYSTFAGDPGETLISFDVTDRGVDHLLYSLKYSPGSLRLKTPGGSEFELRTAAPDATPTDKRVLTCTGHNWDAVITLDENQRRNGKMKVTRHSDAGTTDPPNGSFAVAYTGDTGASDYMAYEGVDGQENGYDFALRRSDLQKTSGSIAQVGLSYTPAFSSAGWHNTLQCTISAR